jgi:hypothetical protein
MLKHFTSILKSNSQWQKRLEKLSYANTGTMTLHVHFECVELCLETKECFDCLFVINLVPFWIT